MGGCCDGGGGVEGRDVLHTRTSMISTMKPRTPPPVPYCHALELVAWISLAVGAAKARAARQSWRRRESMVGECFVVGFGSWLGWCAG